MEQYQYWINLITMICSVLVLSLAWNSTYWIKDKINRALAFILCIQIYTDVIWRYKKVDDVWAHQSNDEVIMFIYKAIDINFSNIYFLMFAYGCLLLLFLRIGYQTYSKYKGKFK